MWSIPPAPRTCGSTTTRPPPPRPTHSAARRSKRALYALGDDRAARQRLAMRNGLAAIGGNPGWFARKAWGELQFFALQYFDDMRARRAIFWLPPAEVAAAAARRWPVAGAAARRHGRAVAVPTARATRQCSRTHASQRVAAGALMRAGVFVPWALYTLLTAGLFHTELRQIGRRSPGAAALRRAGAGPAAGQARALACAPPEP
ncbi:MAG: hypothetical protein U0Z44_16255 [Kouleothrix sp.]